MIGRLFKLMLVLAVLAGIALVAYAYSGMMQPPTREITRPVDLNVD